MIFFSLTSDINECGQSNGGCQQICINRRGSHTCACKKGYELASDKSTCIELEGKSCPFVVWSWSIAVHGLVLPYKHCHIPLHIFCLIGNSIFHLSLEILTDFAKKRLEVSLVVAYFCSLFSNVLAKIGCFDRKKVHLRLSSSILAKIGQTTELLIKQDFPW